MQLALLGPVMCGLNCPKALPAPLGTLAGCSSQVVAAATHPQQSFLETATPSWETGMSRQIGMAGRVCMLLNLSLPSPSIPYFCVSLPSFLLCSSSNVRHLCGDCTALPTPTGWWVLVCCLCSLLSMRLQPTSLQWQTGCMLLVNFLPQTCNHHLVMYQCTFGRLVLCGCAC